MLEDVRRCWKMLFKTRTFAKAPLGLGEKGTEVSPWGIEKSKDQCQHPELNPHPGAALTAFFVCSVAQPHECPLAPSKLLPSKHEFQGNFAFCLRRSCLKLSHELHTMSPDVQLGHPAQPSPCGRCSRAILELLGWPCRAPLPQPALSDLFVPPTPP